MNNAINVGFLMYPHLTQLDLTGPAQVFSCASDMRLHFVWKTMEPVPSDASLSLMPTHTFDTCPELDVICVPGGPGQQQLMHDQEVLNWLRMQARTATWLTSVCSGSLLLGAAGLLKGYRAACHWNYRRFLPLFGATVDESRVVVDRNRITGGGVTAGVDFALTLVAKMRGEAQAREIQLLLEYSPQPPFDSGRPELASSELIAVVQRKLVENVKATSTR